MRKKKTFEYTSYFAAEFNGFLQYRISGGSNGLEERRVLKSLDDYLIQSGMVKKKLDGIIVDAWINSLNVGGNTKAHYVSVYRQFAHYLTGLGYKAYIPPPLQIKRNYTPYVFTSEEMKRLFEACDNIPARRSLTKAEVWLPVMVRMLYGCGLRVGEAVSLQNKDIDWTEVWGDRIFEKCGIGRDEGGDGGKTLEIRGKRRLPARDRGANYQQS